MFQHFQRGLLACGLMWLAASVPPVAPRSAPVPSAALALMAETPFDDSSAIEIESPENSAAGDARYISRVSYQRVGEQQVWRLRQREDDGPWIDYGLAVIEGRTYFAELGDEPKLHGQGCASCHANGPRALYGILREGTGRAAWNIQVENMPVVSTYYPPDSRPEKLDPLDVPGCARCHDGRRRTMLTRENSVAIAFRLQAGTMPPAGPASDALRDRVEAWLSAGHS